MKKLSKFQMLDSEVLNESEMKGITGGNVGRGESCGTNNGWGCSSGSRCGGYSIHFNGVTTFYHYACLPNNGYSGECTCR